MCRPILNSIIGKQFSVGVLRLAFIKSNFVGGMLPGSLVLAFKGFDTCVNPEEGVMVTTF